LHQLAITAGNCQPNSHPPVFFNVSHRLIVFMRLFCCLRPRALFVLLPFAPILAGCGHSEWPERHPTSVKVLYDGKPPVGATIRLEPVEGFDPKRPIPKGEVQEDGTVAFTTYTGGDGVPEGEYYVCAFWYANGVPPNKLPARYMDAATSGMRVKIDRGFNELPTINLTK
jgi:hypothetical protein